MPAGKEQSGQTVRLTNEEGASRIYPVASLSCDGRHLLFLIRRRADDDFGQSVLADWLHVYLVHEPARGDKVLNLFRSWEDALDNFRLTGRPQLTDAYSLHALLHNDHPDLNKCNLYVAGPDLLVNPLAQILERNGGADGVNMRLIAAE